MENVLVDSGYWFALYASDDQYHDSAIKLSDHLESANIIIPFPSLYESINTRFMKNSMAKNRFEAVLKRRNVEIIYDESIKDEALEITFREKSKKRNLSLVDNIIRLILEDRNFKIDYLITFNRADFVDICNNRNIRILEQ
jgi:predicted nucleic acid-binding protein